MAIERRGACVFYARKVRKGRRVRSEYVASGEMAVLAARLDQIERDARRAEAIAWRAECERLDAEEAMLDDLCGRIENLSRAALLAAGCHRHHKGEWRRRRGQEA